MSADLPGEITARHRHRAARRLRVNPAAFAILAFREQSKEVSGQAEMLEVQSGRLELYRKQVDDQHEINLTHGRVLELQAKEISASLKQRERDAEEERRRQASRLPPGSRANGTSQRL